MDDAVWNPCDDIKDRMRKSGEDIGDVGTVENRFQSGQCDHGDRRTQRVWYETCRVISEQPRKDGCCGYEKLGGEGYNEGDGVQDGYQELVGECRRLHDSEPEGGIDDMEDVDCVGKREFVLAEFLEGVLRR